MIFRLVSFYFCCVLFTFKCFGQNKSLIKYTLETGLYDTLSIVNFDTTIRKEKTDFYYGIDSLIEFLPQTLPSQNTYPSSLFTKKRKAALDFNLNKFPIRTSIKIFEENDDTLSNNCSGVMISKKHVLTAAHCFLNFQNDSIFQDSILTCPVYDKGFVNSLFSCSYVKCIYFFNNWNFSGEDFAILELNDSIGLNTGWVSIGFDEIDSSLLDGIFFKFSYPSTTFLSIDSNTYNGDTIYYNYGEVNMSSNSQLGITSASGIPGESGSSLIKVKNNSEYTSYGTLSFSNNLSHSRITDYSYFAIKNIIESATSVNGIEKINVPLFTVYPNPTKEMLFIRSKENDKQVDQLTVYDAQGISLINESDLRLPYLLNLSNRSKGLYFVFIQKEERTSTLKVIKE